MAKIKVLVAEEHTLCCEAICALLRNHKDIEVIDQASNGKEVLEKANEHMPDVVLMDSAMPIMNGVEVTRQLRKRNVTSRVLLITIYENKDIVLSALRAGVNGFISKKATGSDLVSAIFAVSRGDFFLYPSVAKIMVRDYLQDLKKPVRPDPFESDPQREIGDQWL